MEFEDVACHRKKYRPGKSQNHPMKKKSNSPYHTVSLFLMLPISAVSFSFLTSCATEEVQERADRRNDWLERMGENAEIRQDARDARYDRQFDRLMD